MSQMPTKLRKYIKMNYGLSMHNIEWKAEQAQ